MLKRLSFIPRELKFFDRFEAGVQNLLKASHALLDLMENYEDVEDKVRGITRFEEEGDEVTHEIFAMLNKTFVTLIDREDIALLTHSIDDVTDMIEAAADRMWVYGIEAPTPLAVRLTKLIVKQAEEMEKAMPLLRKKSHMTEVLAHAIEINRLENEADRVLREALMTLFRDVGRVTWDIRWREIYEHLEMATDRAEDVANVLEAIVLKHA